MMTNRPTRRLVILLRTIVVQASKDEQFIWSLGSHWSLEDKPDTSIESIQESGAAATPIGIDRAEIKGDGITHFDRIEEGREVVSGSNLHAFQRIPIQLHVSIHHWRELELVNR